MPGTAPATLFVIKVTVSPPRAQMMLRPRLAEGLREGLRGTPSR